MGIKKICFPIGIVVISSHIASFRKHGLSEQEKPFIIMFVYINIFIPVTEIK